MVALALALILSGRVTVSSVIVLTIERLGGTAAPLALLYLGFLIRKHGMWRCVRSLCHHIRCTLNNRATFGYRRGSSALTDLKTPLFWVCIRCSSPDHVDRLGKLLRWRRAARDQQLHQLNRHLYRHNKLCRIYIASFRYHLNITQRNQSCHGKEKENKETDNSRRSATCKRVDCDCFACVEPVILSYQR